MATQVEQATGRWDSVTLDLLSVGDRVRVTHLRDGNSEEGAVTHLHCSMNDTFNPFDTRRAVQLTTDSPVRFCAHSDTWDFFKWVVEAPVAAFTWVTVPSTQLAVGDHVRGVGRADTVEGVVERVSGAGYVKLDTSAGNLSPARRWERRTTVASAPEAEPTPAPSGTDLAGSARPEYTWVEVSADDLVRGDTVRAIGFPTDVHGRDDVWQEGEFTSITTSGGYRYARINGHGCDVRRRFMRRTLVTSDAPMNTVVLARPQVGDHFTRTFNTPTTGNPPRREGCVVTSVRDVGDAPGQDLWVITYTQDFTVWDRGLLVRPDGTCMPNDPSEQDGRDLSGRYEPVTTPTTGGWIPATTDTLQVGDVVRARPGSILGLMQARVIRTPTPGLDSRPRFHATTIDVIEPSRNGRTSDMSRTDGGYYYYRFNEDPAPLVWRGEGPAPDVSVPTVQGTVPAPSPTPVAAPTPEAGTWSDVNSLLLSEGDRARWRYDSDSTWSSPVTVTEVDSDGDVYIEGSRDYVTGSRSRNWQRWTPARVQADGTPLPDWATSLDAARRHVHAKARELFVSRDNCASGTADFLSAAGLPDLRRNYPAPPDETEQIRAFLTTVREAAITTANRHGKTMSLVHTWLRREGITEPAPPPVQYTITVEVPAGVTEQQVRTEAASFASGPDGTPSRNWRIVSRG